MYPLHLAAALLVPHKGRARAVFHALATRYALNGHLKGSVLRYGVGGADLGTDTAVGTCIRVNVISSLICLNSLNGAFFRANAALRADVDFIDPRLRKMSDNLQSRFLWVVHPKTGKRTEHLTGSAPRAKLRPGGNYTHG